ncbi:MAG: hypothetical protein IJC64_02370 [Clostridia bacterium]|nr:hypothetical protein [Clostridia bacterium]
MGQIDKGILLFPEWLEAMESLPGTDFKRLTYAIYNYQMKGIEPPEFKGKARIVAAMIFPYVRRRIENSRAGKKGMQARYGVNPIIDELLRRREQERASSADNGVNN